MEPTRRLLLRVLGVVLIGCSSAEADDVASHPEGRPAAAAPADSNDAQPVPLNPQKTVLLDAANRRLILNARAVLREGVLEMFLCKAQTKEHESILAIDSEAYLIHAGLLALGAKPGRPAMYDEEYHPPTGQKIDIFVNWSDESGVSHRVPAQQWVRHVTRRFYEEPLEKVPAGVQVGGEHDLRYDPQNKLLIWFGPMTAEQRDELLKASPDPQYQSAIRAFHEDSQSRELKADWVFVGSGFFQHEDGTQWYQAEGGNLICVANFSDAMIDVSVESSASNAALLFEPYTERIPPLETPVTLELVPVFEQPGEE